MDYIIVLIVGIALGICIDRIAVNIKTHRQMMNGKPAILELNCSYEEFVKTLGNSQLDDLAAKGETFTIKGTYAD